MYASEYTTASPIPIKMLFFASHIVIMYFMPVFYFN